MNPAECFCRNCGQPLFEEERFFRDRGRMLYKCPNCHYFTSKQFGIKERKLTLVSFIIHGIHKPAFVYLEDNKLSGEELNQLIEELYSLDYIPRGTTITIGG